MRKRFLQLLLILLTVPSFSSAGDVQEAYRSSQAAIGKYIGGYTLTGQDKRRFTIKEFTGGKPLVVNFIYTGCTETCSTVTAGLEKAFKKAGGGFGDKFKALTVGFDAENDSPDMMNAFGNRFTKDFNSWKFASADRSTVETLAKDFGFYYEKSRGGFEHFNMITVVNANGRVFRQIYGVDFNPDEVLAAVTEAVSRNGTLERPAPSSIIERIVLLCYTYDEATGTYRLDYSFLVLLGLGATVKSMLAFLAIYLFRSRRAIPPLLAKKL